MFVNSISSFSKKFQDHKILFAFAFFSTLSGIEISIAGSREVSTIRLAQESTEDISSNDIIDEEEQLRRIPRVSNEDRTRLRRDLDTYSRSLDPVHSQIEENRILMRKRIQERFFQADKDNNQTLSRIEATEMMPQIARHFTEVDLNSDGEITINELAVAMNKALERQRIEEAQLAEVEQRAADVKSAEAKSIDMKKSEIVSGKSKTIKATDSVRKRSL